MNVVEKTPRNGAGSLTVVVDNTHLRDTLDGRILHHRFMVRWFSGLVDVEVRDERKARQHLDILQGLLADESGFKGYAA